MNSPCQGSSFCDRRSSGFAAHLAFRKKKGAPTMATNPYPAERVSKNTSTTNFPRVVQQCLSAKQQIINELIAGRLPLLEATARFQAEHSTSAACLATATGVPMTNGDGENMCRTVIGWVFLTLSNRPEEAERVSTRLELELQGHLDTCGKVNLPLNC